MRNIFSKDEDEIRVFETILGLIKYLHICNLYLNNMQSGLFFMNWQKNKPSIKNYLFFFRIKCLLYFNIINGCLNFINSINI